MVVVHMQGLRAWLVGPQLGLRDSASCSAIVLAVDRGQPPQPKLLIKLRNQVPATATLCFQLHFCL